MTKNNKKSEQNKNPSEQNGGGIFDFLTSSKTYLKLKIQN